MKERIEVPITELEKLEQARKDLYQLLAPAIAAGGTAFVVRLEAVTNQMWRVSNRKVWR